MKVQHLRLRKRIYFGILTFDAGLLGVFSIFTLCCEGFNVHFRLVLDHPRTVKPTGYNGFYNGDNLERRCFLGKTSQCGDYSHNEQDFFLFHQVLVFSAQTSFQN